MLALKLPVFSSLRARFRRRTSETVTDTLSDALTVFPRGFPLRVPPSSVRPKAPQHVAELADEIAELYKELKANVAARDARTPTTVAAPDDESAIGGATLPSSIKPSPAHPEPSSVASTDEDDLSDDVTSHIKSMAIYPVDGNVSKENIARFQVRGLRKLDLLIPEADFPDVLFVHYIRISSTPVAYVRALPTLLKDAHGCVDWDVLERGAGLCPRVAHLHVSDDEQVTRAPRSSERNAVLSLAVDVDVGKERSRSVLRNRVIAKLTPRACAAHKALRSTARFMSDTVGRYLAAGRPLPVDCPMFYGMYLPYESLTREMHAECGSGAAGCVEMPPIVLVEEVELPVPASVAAPPVRRAACAEREAPACMRPFALDAPAVLVM
ncbi:hypothetical protein C8T65DRAFT_102693 [Cerioporus squamosus]|nr:hypothetical protein C8T65DRAFT_102693 [Cerioporus squamosus]